MLINFVSSWRNLEIIFNYINETNWGIVHLIWERTGHGGIQWGVQTDGVWDSDYIVRDLSPTDYILKVNVNNYDGTFEIYVDSVLEYTETM